MTPATATPTALPRRPAKRFARLTWLLLLAVTGIVALAAWALLASSWLATGQVSVDGESTLSDREVVAAASVELGTPLIRLDLDAIERRVSALPPVAAVKVHRDWPSTLSISIAERQPIATLTSSGRWWALDAEGVLFRRVPQPSAHLPVVEVADSSEDAVVQGVASVIAALPPDLLAKVKRLIASSMDSITLDLEDGQEVRWGSSAETQQKVKVLRVLLLQRAAVYDVSVPAQPTTAGDKQPRD